MADHDRTAGEVDECLLQRAERVDVEVVRRLVQQKQVAASCRSFARWTRLRSPPERSSTSFCWSPPRKLNRADVLPRVHLALAEQDRVLAAGDLLPDGVRALERVADLVDVRELDRLADSSSPPSGFSSPTIMLKRVVLPAPFGPMTPTMPPGGRSKVRSSTSSLSPKPFCTWSGLTTRRQGADPAGMWISTVRSAWPGPPPGASRRPRVGPCTWPGGRWGSCAPTRARAAASGGARRSASPRRRGAPPSARATRSSFP